MNDEETVALIAGGHTFGKTHGAGDATHVGPEPEAAGIEEQGLGWKSSFGTGKGGDTITSGLEVTWTTTPTKWSNNFFWNLFGYEWELTKSPAGAHQWTPKDGAGAGTVPDAHDPSKRHAPTMLTTDLALRFDPAYEKISRRFLREPGPVRRRLRPRVVQADPPRHGPARALSRPGGPGRGADLAGPDPRRRSHADRRSRTSPRSRRKILASGLSVSELVSTAWASASTFRGSDKRGGANGARIRLAPQKDWEVNQPAQLAKVLKTLEGIQSAFNGAQSGGKKVSLADLIVLGGCAAVEQAAKNAGHDGDGPLHARPHGRLAGADRRRAPSPCSSRSPTASATTSRPGSPCPAEELLVDKAQLLTLTAPEMTVLVGGLRVLNANFGQSQHGVFTKRPGDADQRLLRQPARHGHGVEGRPRRTRTLFEGRDRETGELKWTGTRVDLVFGSNSQLRALAEVYASADAQEKFVHDFVAAWNKVMNLDRFDLC